MPYRPVDPPLFAHLSPAAVQKLVELDPTPHLLIDVRFPDAVRADSKLFEDAINIPGNRLLLQFLLHISKSSEMYASRVLWYVGLMCYSLNRTPVFKWYMARLVAENGHQKVSHTLRWDWSMCLKCISHLMFNSEHQNWEVICDHWMSKRILPGPRISFASRGVTETLNNKIHDAILNPNEPNGRNLLWSWKCLQ